MDFYSTNGGRRFIDGTMPAVARALERIAICLESKSQQAPAHQQAPAEITVLIAKLIDLRKRLDSIDVPDEGVIDQLQSEFNQAMNGLEDLIKGVASCPGS